MSDILSMSPLFFHGKLSFARGGEGEGGEAPPFRIFLQRVAKGLLFPTPGIRGRTFPGKAGKMDGSELRKCIRHDTFSYSLFALR